MRKLCARWVPRMLTLDQKYRRMEVCKQLLDEYSANPDEFLSHLVTQDETWVHHFEPETKRQSLQWRHVTSPPPKTFKVVPSAKKVMASVFWDKNGIIMVEYLPKGSTVTGAYYADQLRRLRECVKKTRRGLLRKGVWLLQDNAPPHTSQIAIAAADQCGYRLLPHPPYSPDLAPSDYYLFANLKLHVKGRRYNTDCDVMDAVDEFFEGCSADWFKRGLAMLENRWQACIAAKGDYFEK